MNYYLEKKIEEIKDKLVDREEIQRMIKKAISSTEIKNTLPPTEKQIAFADAIASTLRINFPIASWQYTKEMYRSFISKYVDEYYETITYNYDDDEFIDWSCID